MTFKSFQAQVRPLVEAAWTNHAGLYGVLASDRTERDSWYRDNLWAACRVRSTKDATERQYVALIGWFRHLTPGQDAEATPVNVERFPGIAVQDWTNAQQRAFFKLARKAHAAAYARDDHGADAPLESWLEIKMQEAFKPLPIHGPDSLWRLGGRKDGFDRAMGMLAVIAMDRYWMDRTSEGAEVRLRWQLDRCLTDLSWLEGKPADWIYVRAIHKQAHNGLPTQMEDATEAQLFDVIQMLDTHVRRLCRKHRIRPCCCPTREPQGQSAASLDAWSTWAYYHQPTPGHTRGPDGVWLQQKGVA